MSFRKKKVVKQRAGTTHGRGSMKKGRGAGNRGGRGNAGTGKRGDSKKPSIWKNRKYFGKHGFTSKRKKVIASVNVGTLMEKLEYYADGGLAAKKGDVYELNLKDIGYEKLLGKGSATKKAIITADYASKSAVDKISGAGGKVIITSEGNSEEPEQAEAAEE